MHQLLNIAGRVNSVQAAGLATAALAQYQSVVEINYMATMARNAGIYGIGAYFAWEAGAYMGTVLNNYTPIGRIGEGLYDVLHSETVYSGTRQCR